MYSWQAGTPWYSQPVISQQAQNNAGINWVQGEAGAKGFAVAPGQSVLLMDSESNVFYIKSTDASGMPLPLRTFDYSERVPVTKNVQGDFITREEFEKRLAEIGNAQQPLQSTEQ